MTDDYTHEARRRIMHMNISMADLEVRGTKRRNEHNMNLSDDMFGEAMGRDLRSRGSINPTMLG